jgi:hypothetical protein
MATLEKQVIDLLNKGNAKEAYELIHHNLPKTIAKQYVDMHWANPNGGFMNYVYGEMKEEYIEKIYLGVASEMNLPNRDKNLSIVPQSIQQITDKANTNLNVMYSSSATFRELLKSMTKEYTPYKGETQYRVILLSRHDGGGPMSVGVYETIELVVKDKIELKVFGYNHNEENLSKYMAVDVFGIIKMLEDPISTLQYLLFMKMERPYTLVEEDLK